MTPELSLLVVGAAAVLSLLAWDRGCQCAKCAFHENEKRMARLRHKELNHDAEHKGFGFKAGDPDRQHCADDTCARNRVD